MSEYIVCNSCGWIVEDWQYGNLCFECRLPLLQEQYAFWRGAERYEILRQINEILGYEMASTKREYLKAIYTYL